MNVNWELLVISCLLSFAFCEENLQETWDDGPLIFPYRQNGAGNRDALEVREILLENFDAPEGILKWKTLKVGQTQWALGLRASSFVLLEITPAGNSTHSIKNTVAEMDQDIMDAWIFQVSPTMVVLSISLKVPNSFLYQGSWYKATSSTLEPIYSWPTLEPTAFFTAFQYEETVGVALIKHIDEKSSLEVYRVSLDGTPQITLLNNIWVDFQPTMMVTTLDGQDLYISMVVPSLNAVEVYRLSQFCPRNLEALLLGKLSRLASLPAEDVSEVKGFYVAGRNYLTVDGKNAAIYIFNRNGTINAADTSSDLGYVHEWLALPVATYRQDVLLLAKQEGRVSLFTWAGTNEGFVEKEFPYCSLKLDPNYNSVSSCEDLLFNEPWFGAGLMTIGEAPFFLLPTSSGHSILIHFMTLLHPVLNPDLESISINEKAKQLYDRWQTIWEDFRLDLYANKSELGDHQVNKPIEELTLEETEKLVNETLEILKVANSTFGLSALKSKDSCYMITADIVEENLIQEDEWFFYGEQEVEMSVFPSKGIKLNYSDSHVHVTGAVMPEECAEVKTPASTSSTLREVNAHPRYPTQEEYFRKNDQPHGSLIDYARKHLDGK